MSPRTLPFLRRALGLLVLLAFAAAPALAQDSRIKSWTTAELHGAMKWAKGEAKDRRERSEFGAAEIICWRRLQKQVDEGSISRASVLVISENARKRGVYRGEKLTLERAHELRRLIIGGRLLESLRD
jgi:hypothetical protein